MIDLPPARTAEPDQAEPDQAEPDQAEPDQAGQQAAEPWRLPRRDYILLPLIFVATILVLLGGGEVVARQFYPESDAREACEYLTPTGFRYHPLCVSRSKVWEGPWVTQRFNDCGYPGLVSCALRPPGSRRVVVVGSSTARGALVNYPETFAARASTSLSQRCGDLVDFQNLGTEPIDVDRIALRIPEALTLRPSAIVMTIGPYDLEHLKDPPPTSDAPQERHWRPNLQSMVELLRESRLFLLMQSYLYRDPAFQIRAFLLNGDGAEYVRSPLGPVWQKRVDEFGDLLHRISVQTAPADVPVLLFYLPERAEAALAIGKTWPPGVDPFVLPRALDAAAARNGVQFFDATQAFATAPDFQTVFYLTDGHPREGGHAALATVIEQALLAQPVFAACRLVAQGIQP
jgi:hypothetical protein